MIGIIVADPNEIHSLGQKPTKTVKAQQFTIEEYTINGKQIAIIFSGIGIANSAAATQAIIAYGATELINYGAVGAIKNDDIKVYDLVAPKTITYHDVITPWYQRGQTPGEEASFTNALVDSKIKDYNLASGSSFVFDEQEMIKISKEMNVHIFDMECAAIAQIAHKNNIELKVIKCISDVVGDNNVAVEDINNRIKNAGLKALEYALSTL